MPSDTNQIERVFSEYFARWKIKLPQQVLDHREAGHIFENGWHVGFIWGEENGENYLEFLAQHRMTNDRHVRIYASGRVETLPAAPEWFVVPENASPEERRAAEDAYQAEVRRISADLRDKGLLPPVGGNLAAIDINEFLRSGGESESSSQGET